VTNPSSGLHAHNFSMDRYSSITGLWGPALNWVRDEVPGYRPKSFKAKTCRFAHASFSMHQNISTSATVLQSYLKIRTPSFTQHCRTQSNRTNNNLKQAWRTTGSTTVLKSCRGVRF
jgi:hypothetical protein